MADHQLEGAVRFECEGQPLRVVRHRLGPQGDNVPVETEAFTADDLRGIHFPSQFIGQGVGLQTDGEFEQKASSQAFQYIATHSGRSAKIGDGSRSRVRAKSGKAAA